MGMRGHQYQSFERLCGGHIENLGRRLMRVMWLVVMEHIVLLVTLVMNGKLKVVLLRFCGHNAVVQGQTQSLTLHAEQSSLSGTIKE